jgi:hypothetical protein
MDNCATRDIATLCRGPTPPCTCLVLTICRQGCRCLVYHLWMANSTRLLCARAHRPLAHLAAYSHAEARKSWQRVPDSAHAWLLDLPKVKPATRGTPPRTLPMGKGPLPSPQGRRGPPAPQRGVGGFPPQSRAVKSISDFPCLALPCLALPCLALPCLALPCLFLALPCLALPCLALPCLALPCLQSIDESQAPCHRQKKQTIPEDL